MPVFLFPFVFVEIKLLFLFIFFWIGTEFRTWPTAAGTWPAAGHLVPGRHTQREEKGRGEWQLELFCLLCAC